MPRRESPLSLTWLLVGASLLLGACGAKDDEAKGPAAAASVPRPALTVTVTQPTRADWPVAVTANGAIAAWQEAIIGAEAQGLRLVELRAQVGDKVSRGQVLARLRGDTLAADLAVSRANLAEAEAGLAEAKANADRARQLQPTGAYSAQQTQQYLTAEATAAARVLSVKARITADEVRLAQTEIKAPDDGIVSARNATLGSVVQPGQELFRLIRQQRLEWRAEVAAPDLARVKPGARAHLTLVGGEAVEGRVRMVAPTIDAASRNGMVYVDLPVNGPARAGMYARGELDVGRAPALTLPQTAVALRDGFTYAYQVDAEGKVAQLKLSTGRRQGDRVEVVNGLAPDARVVATGGGFLADGDRVKVVSPAEAKAPTPGVVSTSTPAVAASR